jgi:hypothetical protein
MYYSPNRALRGRSTYRNITYMRYIALRVPAPKELRCSPTLQASGTAP